MNSPEKKRPLADLPPVRRSEELPHHPVEAPSENYGIWYRPDRPRVVGLIGWMLAAIGYAGFVLKGSQLPSYFSDMKWLNPDYKPIPFSRGQFSIAVTILLAEMALALFAIAAGLGALKLKEWGRRATLWYAVIAAVLTIAKTAWQISMFDFMLDYQASTTTQPFDRQSVGNAQFFALLTMTAAQLLWCGIVASLMTRIYVKDAFDRSEAAAAGQRGGWQS